MSLEPLRSEQPLRNIEKSGRRDFAPYTTPAQSHYPLRGFVVDWRPREFGSTLEPDAFEADPSAEFTSGRRDLNPGPLPPQGSALPGCATARMNESQMAVTLAILAVATGNLPLILKEVRKAQLVLLEESKASRRGRLATEPPKSSPNTRLLF